MSDAGQSTDPPPTGNRSRPRLVGAVLILAAVGVAAAVWSRARPPLPDNPPVADAEDGEDAPPAPATNPGYVGVAACAECHAERAVGFRSTRHFRASVPPAGTTAPGFAPGKGFHPTRDPNVHFEMERRAGDLVVTGVRRAPDGEQKSEYQVGLVYGAGGARDEMYFAWQDDRLVQLPVGWLHPQACWGNVVDRVEGREVTPNCLQCHTTWAAHVPGTVNQYRRDDLLPGVTCERCHGPGREHVEHHRAHPNDPAHAVVHPGRLDRERAMDLCAQCHTNVRARGAPFSYRPGEPLDSSFRVVRPRFTEDDIVGNQVRSLRESRCFQGSSMTCTTCHDPHRPENPADVRGTCRACHQPAACKEQPRLPAEVRGDCTACHMPPRVWMNVFFHTAGDQYVPVAARTDHRIGVYPEARQAAVLAGLRSRADAASRAAADRLAADLGAHWLRVAAERQRAGRFRAEIGAVREALRVRPDDATRRRLREAVARQSDFDALRSTLDPRQPEAAVPTLKRLLDIRPDYAAGHSQLGAVYASLGKRDEAVDHLEAVARHDPDDASGLSLLAWMEYVDGRPESAVALSARANEIEPGSAKIHYQWGLALLQLRRWGEAGNHFSAALALRPRHAGASRGLSEAVREQGQTAEAVRHARQAVRWSDGQDVESLLTLARAYAAARREADARRAAEDALDLAVRRAPGLVPTARAELDQLH